MAYGSSSERNEYRAATGVPDWRLSPRFAWQVLSIFMLAALLAGCGSVANTGNLVVGRAYRGEGFIAVGAGGTQVPLPPGHWELVGWSRYPEKLELGGILIRTESNKVAQMIEFYVPLDHPRSDTTIWRKPYGFCARRDIIHNGENFFARNSWYNGGMGWDRQKCWGVHHWPTTFYGSIPEHILALRDNVERRNLEMPSTMISVQFRRSGHGKFMSIGYYFNPELEGFDPSPNTDWRTSEWHRDRVFRDPDRKAYIERLVEWGRKWNLTVEKGFEGELRESGA